MAAPADPSGFRPLLRGLPGALGAFVPSVGERLPAAVEHDRLLGTARAHFDSDRAVTPRSQPRAGAGLSRCGGWCGRAQEGTAGRSRNPARPPRRNPETDRDGIYGSERNGLWRKAVLVGLPEPGCTVNPPITSGKWWNCWEEGFGAQKTGDRPPHTPHDGALALTVATAAQVAAHPWMASRHVKAVFFLVPLREEDKPQFAFTWEGT